MSNRTSMEDSFSGYTESTTAHLSREFTEVTLVRETQAHQLFRAKRFGRWYLLKALRPEQRQSEFHRQMLQKEMEILMQLQHPGIVGCLGMDYIKDYTDSEGRLISVGTCIVLEYIDGQTLSELLDSSPRGGWEGATLVDELLSALAYMHAAGIIHRDLKPSNIMITHNGQHVKIIDFSLADTNSYAILKQPAGTRRYIAPEQATATEADERNDIYSFGVILDELLKSSPSSFKAEASIFREIARRCQLPIDRRYESVKALQDDIQRLHQRRTRLRWASLLAAGVLLFLLGTLVNQHRHPGQSRVQEAIEQLEDSMAATQLTQHIDTLSHWRYLDPEVNEKILRVNAFIYDYTDNSLADCPDSVRNDIRIKMLDHWQAWHDHIVRRAKALIPRNR